MSYALPCYSSAQLLLPLTISGSVRLGNRLVELKLTQVWFSTIFSLDDASRNKSFITVSLHKVLLFQIHYDFQSAMSSVLVFFFLLFFLCLPVDLASVCIREWCRDERTIVVIGVELGGHRVDYIETRGQLQQTVERRAS